MNDMMPKISAEKISIFSFVLNGRRWKFRRIFDNLISIEPYLFRARTNQPQYFVYVEAPEAKYWECDSANVWREWEPEYRSQEIIESLEQFFNNSNLPEPEFDFISLVKLEHFLQKINYSEYKIPQDYMVSIYNTVPIIKWEFKEETINVCISSLFYEIWTEKGNLRKTFNTFEEIEEYLFHLFQVFKTYSYSNISEKLEFFSKFGNLKEELFNKAKSASQKFDENHLPCPYVFYYEGRKVIEFKWYSATGWKVECDIGFIKKELSVDVYAYKGEKSLSDPGDLNIDTAIDWIKIYLENE